MTDATLAVERPCVRIVTLGKLIFNGCTVKDGLLNVQFNLADFSPAFKQRDFDLITSEKIRVLPKTFFDYYSPKQVSYSLNGHLIETHYYIVGKDYNFAFDLAPTPKPNFPQDLAGLWYNDQGLNTFTIKCQNPFYVKSIFLYRAYIPTK
jgi:hypothetical protein